MFDDLEEMPKNAGGGFFSKVLKVKARTVHITSWAMITETQIACKVEYIGDMTGRAYPFASAPFANKMTSTMLELPESEVWGDQMAGDPRGELADTLVGGLKDAMAALN